MTRAPWLLLVLGVLGGVLGGNAPAALVVVAPTGRRARRTRRGG